MSSPRAPHVVEDCLGIVELLSDGTMRRSTDYSVLPLLGGVPTGLPVQWKDVVYDAARGLRLRMYRPTGGGEEHDEEKKKLPVLVYFHGGGFCIASFELVNFHAGALRLAAELPALVLSADYRLAPEHRLPVAFDDADSILAWLCSQASSSTAADAEPWLAESADFGRVFVGGDSAGGTITHHVAARHGAGISLATLCLAGFVFWPFFGGEDPTPSEAASPPGDPLGTALFHQMWRLTLPPGATMDHPFANPLTPGAVPFDRLGGGDGYGGPLVLVVDPDQDVLHDRVVEYVARLKAAGKAVELVVFKGQGHGFFVREPCGQASDELIRVVRRFVHGG